MSNCPYCSTEVPNYMLDKSDLRNAIADVFFIEGELLTKEEIIKRIGELKIKEVKNEASTAVRSDLSKKGQ